MLRKKDLQGTIRSKGPPQQNTKRGENILTKVRRILTRTNLLTDGAPLIYTPKEDGVKPELIYAWTNGR